jgi:hypothetical protein
VNKKLGDKFEISEAELASTLEACNALLAEGQDLDSGAGATQVRARAPTGLAWCAACVCLCACVCTCGCTCGLSCGCHVRGMCACLARVSSGTHTPQRT